MFMVLSSWQSHCECSPGSFDECRTAPSGRQPKTKPDELGCDFACTGCQNLPPPSPFILITQPEIWYSFYRLSGLQHQWWNEKIDVFNFTKNINKQYVQQNKTISTWWTQNPSTLSIMPTSSHILQTSMPIANPTTKPSNLIHVRRTEWHPIITYKLKQTLIHNAILTRCP